MNWQDMNYSVFNFVTTHFCTELKVIESCQVYFFHLLTLLLGLIEYKVFNIIAKNVSGNLFVAIQIMFAMEAMEIISKLLAA